MDRILLQELVDKDKKIFFDNMECSARVFEENRFFPVQMANIKE